MNVATVLRTEKSQPHLPADELQPNFLTQTILSKLSSPATSSDFGLHEAVNDVLKSVGMSSADSGGELSFYGRDPIIPSPHRFATMAGVALAARSIAIAALWRD